MTINTSNNPHNAQQQGVALIVLQAGSRTTVAAQTTNNIHSAVPVPVQLCCRHIVYNTMMLKRFDLVRTHLSTSTGNTVYSR
jgi:hypothetical protein